MSETTLDSIAVEPCAANWSSRQDERVFLGAHWNNNACKDRGGQTSNRYLLMCVTCRSGVALRQPLRRILGV